MATKAVWEYHGGSEQSALLVQFANGNIQSPESVKLNLYRNKNEKTPKTKERKILAAESDRMGYVANNFGGDSSNSNSLCRYFVGVLNKESGKMEVHDAEYFKMQPILESNKNKDLLDEDPLENSSRTYREKVDALIEAFGTNKQKRALSSRRLNQVGSEILSQAMAKAAEEIIEYKGTKELVKEAICSDEIESSLFLPPRDINADKPENVYKLDDLISPVEYASLEAPSEPFRNLTTESLQQMIDNKQHGLIVIQELQELTGKDCDHLARCLWYLDALIKLSNMKVVKRKELMVPGFPSTICGKFMKHFTVTTFKNGRVQNSVSGTMNSKIVAHVIALALHICDFEVDLTLLQRDMKLTENRILEIAKAMGLKITKRLMFSSNALGETHKIGVLTLPLTVYKPPGGIKKRKKM
ncbi:DNA-directed RNA polymerase I subunit RPA49 [Pelobates cultripes]|uniref:DNA-directed RNA polymerase I subunit RPA49 n=1 Tax=Pelobates cultripes TaxID=61616 RepID=A0AAD1S653_PELCU|nr:DNA-directed RNA polymerase I subunit RPA49 [Pelobates cultripes]CAH2293581.1 DNA-directed RNA polymerase I subunit RPA49 [Pelobates cultripes]